MEQKCALVLGASGLTGNYCLPYLLESESYKKVIALVRRPIDIQHPKILVAVVDFDLTSTMEKYYEGVDDVFCCLGTNIQKAGSLSTFRRVDFHIPVEAANIASGHGVKQFLAISAHEANNHSSNNYLRIKGEMEAGLAQFNFSALHIFRQQHLTEDLGEVYETKKSGNFFSGIFGSKNITHLSKSIKISPKILAAAMVHVAQLNKAGKNLYNAAQILELSGMETG